MLQVLNVEALSRASVAFVGEEMTRKILALYQIIDKAMHDGYELGVYEASQNVEEAIDTAFDEGYDHGSEAADGAAWDEGYLEGVSDARARPGVADETVGDIIAGCAQFAINGEFDIDLVTDSGDEA